MDDLMINRNILKGQKLIVSGAVETNFSHIPMDIVHNILLRLPAKSLLPSKAVCKSWCSLILDAQFIKSHVNLVNKSYNNVNYISVLDDEGGCFRTDDSWLSICTSITNRKDSEIEHYKMVYPFKRRRNAVLGSCNGLLLVSTTIETYFWNPVTGKYRKSLPTRNIWEKYHGTNYVSGLGYDSLLDEYKAVIYCVHRGQPHMFILSSRTGYWKEVDGDHGLPYSIYNHCSMYNSHFPNYQGFTVNGAPHWMGPDPSNADRTIIYFDVVEEKFKKLPTPTMSWWNDLDMYAVDNIGILGGCLCIAHKNFADGLFEFWVMKDYGVTESWSKLFVIQDSAWSMKPLGFTKNGDEVVLLIGTTRLVTYNLKTGEKKYVNPIVEDLRIIVAAAYVESLVSPLSN